MIARVANARQLHQTTGPDADGSDAHALTEPRVDAASLPAQPADVSPAPASPVLEAVNESVRQDGSRP